ncbi:class I SAM-dependent methyltransferase [candidate division KSB1 bacterium]|nr:class I SAM-dependent methyltransferase [candidate division KSB1 bacterium]
MLDKLIRYGEVERILGPHPAGTILEVGAGPQGLGACLPHPFVGVDPWYPEPPIPQQKAVRASGMALPFRDRSFDIVLCIEVLEHLPEAWRAPVVQEMCRVARRQIIITHPAGKIGRIADTLLSWQYDLLRPLGVRRPWWLDEHFQNPLPDPTQYLPGNLQHFKVRIQGQENGMLHIGCVFFGNLKSVARRVKNSYDRHPEFVKQMVHRLNFPPYYRIMCTLERVGP